MSSVSIAIPTTFTDAQRQRLAPLLRLRGPFQRAYRDNPVAFVHDKVVWPDGASIAPYQEEILDAIAHRQRVCVRAPHGAGKTATMALAIIWFALTRDGEGPWKCATLASAWRQLTFYLAPEWHLWAQRVRWERTWRDAFVAGREELSMGLKLSTGTVFSMVSNQPALIEGAHAPQLMACFDESKAIPDGTWDAMEGAFSTGEVRWVAISTPGSQLGRFYDIQSRKPGYGDWWVRHITLDEAIRAGRIDPAWVEQRKAQWGETSAVYRNRVLGEFAEDDVSGIIPLSAVERAQLRWDADADWGPVTSIGVDVGGGMVGSDRSTIAIAHGLRVREVRTVETGGDPSTATMQLAGIIRGLAEKHRRAEIYIDSVGIGLGVLHRLRELGVNAYGFNAGAGTQLRDQSSEMSFFNWRAAGWWLMREMMMGEEFSLALPPDDDLTGELTAPRRRAESTGRIQVEDKAQVRKRVGRSPDKADAVMHALTGPVLIREMGQNRQRIVDATWRVR